MEKLRVKLLAFANAEESVYTRGKKRFLNILNKDKVEFVAERPDILLFLSGGSERAAVSQMEDYLFYLLIASKDDNSYASATEVKAWCNQNQISSMLCDLEQPELQSIVDDLFHVKNGIHKLKGQRLGLIGNVSDWLVASNVSPFVLSTKLGVELVKLDWNEIPIRDNLSVPGYFADTYNTSSQGVSKDKILDSGKVYEQLALTVSKFNLDAITVECFPMVNECKISACLALSKFNADLFTAGCEGDLCSAAGMMISREICGVVPWMANTVSVSGSVGIFAHCAVPLNLLSDFELDSHFETNEGLAVRGNISAKEVTLFRINSALSHIFITKALVKRIPKMKSACRTQVELVLSNNAVNYFRNNPFGNHHLILPGDYTQRLLLAAKTLKMNVVEAL
jgi:L-fucose isomerase and related proteins